MYMKLLQRSGIFFLTLMVFSIISQCKTQERVVKDPFSITENTYFYWVGGKKGTSGTTIKIVGTTESTNLQFTKIYFQNYEYNVIPQIGNMGFILIGNRSSLIKENITVHSDPKQEYGNQPINANKNIPFDLEQNEALLVYTINGKDFYHKVKDVKQLETVTYP